MGLPVSQERLREDIERNAEFGAVDVPEGRGRTVRTGTDAGMPFASSRDGISHDPLEWTDWEDCAAATRALAGAMARLAGV